ncbi:transposable element Tc1 transposase [Trichonephila clavipes]|nr:transposable element Tc1 transposase [Trichonephila clavipes]
MNSITERRVIHQVKIDPKISAPKIAASTSNTLGRSVSAEMVRRVLRRAGYNGRVARKRPLIGKRNRVKRLKFAKEQILKPQQFWNEVIFSDESMFNIFGSDGRRMVWRKPNTSHHPKHTIPTVKHGGGSVMVWGCTAASGVGKLVFIDGILHKMAYLNILQNNLKESADKLGLGSNFIFQQDNNPKHTAFVVKEWLIYHCRNQLNTPPQSPDLNVIENLWSHLERAVQKHQITSKEQLKSVLQEEWLNIAPETTRHLVESMPRRLEAVISAKVEEGERKVDVAKAFEITLSSLSTILKNKEKIFSASSSRVRKRVSKANFPRLEQCLVSWMRQCRGQNIPMGGSLLKEKAKAFAKELGIEFSASEGWLTNFKKRNGIVFKKMCGESLSVDINVCSKWQNSLSDLIKECEPRNIFNSDETGFFFKCLPEKTFTFKKEKCHGGKHSKERLTILLTVNMDGSEKITSLVIGKSAKPRCFKGINSFPTKYRSNKKAWMTTELFNEWLVSLNSDMKREKNDIFSYF